MKRKLREILISAVINIFVIIIITALMNHFFEAEVNPWPIMYGMLFGRILVEYLFFDED